MRRGLFSVLCGLAGVIVLSGCAVGPGTPLSEMVLPPYRSTDDTVRPPDGYGKASGEFDDIDLLDPVRRAETEAYLKELAER